MINRQFPKGLRMIWYAPKSLNQLCAKWCLGSFYCLKCRLTCFTLGVLLLISLFLVSLMPKKKKIERKLFRNRQARSWKERKILWVILWVNISYSVLLLLSF